MKLYVKLAWIWAHRSGVCTKHIPTPSFLIKNRKQNNLGGRKSVSSENVQDTLKGTYIPRPPPQKRVQTTGSSLNINQKIQTNS